jgi:hypothetical protein
VLDAGFHPDEQAGTAEQELLLAERRAALRETFLDLPSSGQRLIALLIADPPVSYAEIRHCGAHHPMEPGRGRRSGSLPQRVADIASDLRKTQEQSP